MPTSNEFLSRNNEDIDRIVDHLVEVSHLNARCMMGIPSSMGDFFQDLLRTEVERRRLERLNAPRSM